MIPPAAHAYNNVIYGDFEDYIRLHTHTHTDAVGCGARLIESSDALAGGPQRTQNEGVPTAATISANELHDSAGRSPVRHVNDVIFGCA